MSFRLLNRLHDEFHQFRSLLSGGPQIDIDPVHPLTEVAAALIGALSLAIYPGAEGVAGAIFGWLLLPLMTLVFLLMVFMLFESAVLPDKLKLAFGWRDEAIPPGRGS